MLLKLSSKKMELYHLWVTVLLGLMIAAISNARRCNMTSEEDNGCVFYSVTSLRDSCYIHITDQERNFAVRKSQTLIEAILDFLEIVTTRKSRKPETKREDITEIIEENWTRVQANSLSGGEPTAYVIGTEEFHVPSNFSKFKTYIWVNGSLHYTNDTNCFPETTATQSTGTQYMITTQSTTSDYKQSAPTTESVTTAGTSEQWWLYVIIGVLMIVALLAVTVAFLKRRQSDVDDAMVLRHRDGNASMPNDLSLGPQIPDLRRGNTDAGFQTASNQEEPIYEDPDLYIVIHNYENLRGIEGPVTCVNENSGGRHPLSPRQEPMTERGAFRETENMLYGYISRRDY